MSRTCTPLDHGVSKGVVVTAGLVLDGLLDVEKLSTSTFKLAETYPELSFTIKRAPLSLGEFVTAPIEKGSVDFRARTLKASLADVFPLPVPSPTTPTAHAVDYAKANALFTFDTPSPATYGLLARPVLCVRVTQLADATLLTLALPHLIVDGEGIAALLRTLAALYRDEPPVPRADTAALHPDLLALLPPADAGAYDPAEHMTTGTWNVVKYVTHSLRARYGGIEERIVHFPAQMLVRIRDEARSLAEKDGATGPELHVSRLDAAAALLIKIFAHAVPSADAPFDFYHACDLRALMPDLPDPYLHNAFFFLHVAFPSAAHIRAAAPAALAVAVRAGVAGARTPGAARAEIAWHAAHTHEINIAPWRGGARGWGMLSSWNKMGLRTLDFGAGAPRVAFVRGRMQYPVGCEVSNLALSDGDADGGVWADIKVARGQWDRMWAAAGIETL